MTNSSLRNWISIKAIDFGRHIRISKFLPELVKSQWLPPEALAELQIVRLQHILEFASQHVPFYIRLFAKNKWHPNDFCTLTDLEKLPIITKDILRSAPQDFQPEGSNFHEAYKSRRTGGSTGEPLVYRVANDAFGMWWAATLRVWQGTGYSFGDRMFTLGGASLINRQGYAFAQGIYQFLRNNHAFSVGQLDEADLDTIVDQLNAICPSFLYGYPSVLYLVARHILDKSIRVESIKRIITTSEMLFPGQRRLIEQAFHAPVYDEYGCPEAGLIAGECDDHHGMHYAMEICLVEVLDDSYACVPNGIPGHLVATNLVNRSMCLFRYDTGDIGSVSDVMCKCGSGLLQIKNLEGRSRDLIRTPKNKFIHGVEINHLLNRYPWIDRYQIIQETSNDLKINLGVSGVVVPANVEQFRSQLAEFTTMTISVVINEPFIETNGKKNKLIISKIGILDETK